MGSGISGENKQNSRKDSLIKGQKRYPSRVFDLIAKMRSETSPEVMMDKV